MSIRALIAALAERVEHDWRRTGYAHDAFPEVATRALEAIAPYRYDARGLLAAIAGGEDQSAYVGSHVSPQIIPAYWSPKFCISLHAWPDEVGTPHSHSWCGAYQVLDGVSLTGTFTFEEIARYDAKLAVGKLTRTRFDLLCPGATVAVTRGESLIHGIDYLDRLGIALSVRTNENPATLMHGYFAPGVRVSGTTVDVDRIAADRLACIRSLALVAPERAAKAFAQVLRAADARTAFLLLLDGMPQLRAMMDVESLFALASPKFGAHAPLVRAAIENSEREASIRARRARVTRAEHRALLAMLHMAESRNDVERLVSEANASDAPAEFVERTILEMATTAAAPGAATTLLGTPVKSSFDAILKHMLRDPRTERVLAAIAAEYGNATVEKSASTLRRACDTLRNDPLLRPLFITNREASHG